MREFQGSSRRLGALIAALAVVVLAACGGASDPNDYPQSPTSGGTRGRGAEKAGDTPGNTVFGPSGLNIFGGGNQASREGGGTGVGVNSFLWRASLDTISFMPLSSADPFGGVIITEWYSPPETPDERFKMNIYILARELRADGLRVSVFRQNRGADGRWNDAQVTPETAINLENQILTRARQLRVATANR